MYRAPPLMPNARQVLDLFSRDELVALIECVLAHELVHLEHPHHGPDYWAALGRMMPDYEERRKRLRVLGPGLEW